ncbi:MAG TPA: cytochrome c3 family protein [Pyrinomonadaceae bacterium]
MRTGKQRSSIEAVPVDWAKLWIASAVAGVVCMGGAFTLTNRAVILADTSTLGSASPDYSTFSHSAPADHAKLTVAGKCESCHRPTGSLEPGFPKHKDCIGCHVLQFTGASTAAVNPICTICHTSDGLNSKDAPRKHFPGIRTFNAKFDHAQHLQGIEAARPKGGCGSCHRLSRRAGAVTIPARLDAHRVCFECHAAGKQARNFSLCSSCHDRNEPGRYVPTSTNARAFRLSFSHANHARISCQNCHLLKGRGLPQGRQVSSVTAIAHLVSIRAANCKTCHNGQRAFGDTDTHDCKRCHKREGFRMGE